MIVSVRDSCTLQDNALELRVSDQVEQLDQLIDAEGDGRAFFDKTHITVGMDELIREGVKRLAGKSNNAIFHLKQAMGGGKTHVIVGFGLLSKHKSLRQTLFGSVPHVDAFDQVNIAAFNGRNQPSSFFWGEIAQQLGRSDLFRPFWDGGPKAPDERDWLKLFDSPNPTLILLDELPPYFHYYGTQAVGSGTVADIATRAFANMLSAAGKKANVCVVVSDLAASYDTGTKLINRALGDAKQELGRQEHTITPVDLEGNEVYDILRKRLFKTLPSTDQIDEVAQQFAKVWSKRRKRKSPAAPPKPSRTKSPRPILFILSSKTSSRSSRKTRPTSKRVVSWSLYPDSLSQSGSATRTMCISSDHSTSTCHSPRFARSSLTYRECAMSLRRTCGTPTTLPTLSSLIKTADKAEVRHLRLVPCF
jgi:hypothetical protein